MQHRKRTKVTAALLALCMLVSLLPVTAFGLDPQSVELHKTIAEQGAAAALEQYSGLAADHPLSTRILDVYRALAV